MTIESFPAVSGQMGYASIPSSVDFTVGGWFKIVTFDTNWHGIITTGGGPRYAGVWKENVANGNLVVLSSDTAATAFATATEDEWFYVAMSHDNSETNNELDFYFREEGDTSFTVLNNIDAGAVNATDNLYFCDSIFDEELSADYGIFKIWDRVVTADELWLESQVIRPVHFNNLWAWLPCWSATDTTDGTVSGDMRDYSGNGNHCPGVGNFRNIDNIIGNNIPMVPYGNSGILIPAAVAGSTPIGVSDSGDGADSIDVAVSVPVSDSGAGADVLSISAQVAIADAGSGAEALAIAVELALADTGSGVDAVDVLVGNFVDLDDSGAGSDALAITASIPLADTGAGADGLVVTVQIPLADAGSGSDVVDVVTGSFVSVSDSGSGAENLGITVSFSIADAGAGSDAVNIGVSVQAADTGSASESITVAADLSLADTGAAIEQALISAVIQLADSGVGIESINIPEIVRELGAIVKARRHTQVVRSEPGRTEFPARRTTNIRPARKLN